MNKYILSFIKIKITILAADLGKLCLFQDLITRRKKSVIHDYRFAVNKLELTLTVK